MEYELTDLFSLGLQYPTRRNGETTSFQKHFERSATITMRRTMSDGRWLYAPWTVALADQS
jgi:hypothetical protein